MEAFRTRHGASRVAAVAFLLVSVGIGVFSGVFNLFAVDVVGSSWSAAAGPGSWIGQSDQWQWDAITALGLAGAVVAAYVLSACIHGRRVSAFAAAAAWAIVEGGLVRLVWHASPNSGGDLVLWQLAGAAVLVAAVALIPDER